MRTVVTVNMFIFRRFASEPYHPLATPRPLLCPRPTRTPPAPFRQLLHCVHPDHAADPSALKSFRDTLREAWATADGGAARGTGGGTAIGPIFLFSCRIAQILGRQELHANLCE